MHDSVSFNHNCLLQWHCAWMQRWECLWKLSWRTSETILIIKRNDKKWLSFSIFELLCSAQYFTSRGTRELKHQIEHASISPASSYSKLPTKKAWPSLKVCKAVHSTPSSSNVTSFNDSENSAVTNLNQSSTSFENYLRHY